MKKTPFSPNEINLSNLEFQDEKGLAETFKCLICQNLAFEPLFCRKCGSVYCRKCLAEYSKRNCNNEQPQCLLKCGSRTFVEPAGKFKEISNYIKIKCVYKGCYAFIDYSDYDKHLKKCNFKKYHCNNKPCTKEGLLHEMEDHVNKCIYRRIVCQFCKKKIIFNKMENHLKQDCPEYIVKCIDCGINIKKEGYEKHKSDKVNCLKQKKLSLENKVKELENDSLNINNQINMLKASIQGCEDKLKEIVPEGN